jgi:hypothetical protein
MQLTLGSSRFVVEPESSNKEILAECDFRQTMTLWPVERKQTRTISGSTDLTKWSSNVEATMLSGFDKSPKASIASCLLDNTDLTFGNRSVDFGIPFL